MIRLSDVSLLITSGRIVLPHDGRAPARHAHRSTLGAGLGPGAGTGARKQDRLQIPPTFYRRNTDALQTTPKPHRRRR